MPSNRKRPAPSEHSESDNAEEGLDMVLDAEYDEDEGSDLGGFIVRDDDISSSPTKKAKTSTQRSRASKFILDEAEDAGSEEETVSAPPVRTSPKKRAVVRDRSPAKRPPTPESEDDDPMSTPVKRTASKTTKKKLPAPDADEDDGAILVEDSADEELEVPASPRKIASPGKKVVKMVPEVVISTPPPSKRVARAPASTSSSARISSGQTKNDDQPVSTPTKVVTASVKAPKPSTRQAVTKKAKDVVDDAQVDDIVNDADVASQEYDAVDDTPQATGQLITVQTLDDMELEYPLSYNWEEPDVDETYDPDFADPFVHAESHNLARLRMVEFTAYFDGLEQTIPFTPFTLPGMKTDWPSFNYLWIQMFMMFQRHGQFVNLSRCPPTLFDWSQQRDPAAHVLSLRTSMGLPAVCLSVVVVDRADLTQGQQVTSIADKDKGRLSYRRVLQGSLISIDGERLMAVIGATLGVRTLKGQGGIEYNARGEQEGYISFVTKPGKFLDPSRAQPTSPPARQEKSLFSPKRAPKTGSKKTQPLVASLPPMRTVALEYSDGVSIVDMTGAGMGDNPESILDNLRQLRPWPHLNPNRHSICLVAHTVTTYKTITKSKEEVLKIGFNLLWMGVLVGDRGINSVWANSPVAGPSRAGPSKSSPSRAGPSRS